MSAAPDEDRPVTLAEARALVAAQADEGARRALVRSLIRREMSAAEEDEWRTEFAGRGKVLGSLKAFDAIRREAKAELAQERKQARKSTMRLVRAEEEGPVRHSLYKGDEYFAYPANGNAPAHVTYISRSEDEERMAFAGELAVDEVREVRNVTNTGEPGSEISVIEYAVTYTAPNGRPATTTVDDSELDVPARSGDEKWTARVGMIETHAARGVIDRSVKAFAANERGVIERVSAYSATGILLIDGRYVFLRNGRPALTGEGPSSDYLSYLPSSLYRGQTWAEKLSYPDPNPKTAAEDMAALLGVLGVSPDDPAMVAILANLARNPFTGIGDMHPLALLLSADTGTGKGIYQATSYGLQSGGLFIPTAGHWDPPAILADEATTPGLSNLLHYVRGYVVPIIDVAQEGATEKERRASEDKVNKVTRGVAQPGGAAPKMTNKPKKARESVLPRASVIFDAETDFGGSRTGTKARQVIVNLSRDPFRLAESAAAGLPTNPAVDRLYESLPAGSRALSGMIVNTLADMTENGGTPRHSLLGRANSWAQEAEAEWKLPESTHKRIKANARDLLTGAYLLGEHAGRVGIADPAEVRAELSEKLRPVFADQSARTVRRSALRTNYGRTAEAFVRALRAALVSGEILVSSTEGRNILPDLSLVPKGRTLSVFGWEERTISDRSTFAERVIWQKGQKVSGESLVAVRGRSATGRRAKWPVSESGLCLIATPNEFALLVEKLRAKNPDAGIPSADEIRAELSREANGLSPILSESTGVDFFGGNKRAVMLDLERVLSADDDDQGPGEAGELAEVDGDPTDPAPAAVAPAPAVELVELVDHEAHEDGQEDEEDRPALFASEDPAEVRRKGEAAGAALRERVLGAGSSPALTAPRGAYVVTGEGRAVGAQVVPVSLSGGFGAALDVLREADPAVSVVLLSEDAARAFGAGDRPARGLETPFLSGMGEWIIGSNDAREARRPAIENSWMSARKRIGEEWFSVRVCVLPWTAQNNGHDFPLANGTPEEILSVMAEWEALTGIAYKGTPGTAAVDLLKATARETRESAGLSADPTWKLQTRDREEWRDAEKDLLPGIFDRGGEDLPGDAVGIDRNMAYLSAASSVDVAAWSLREMTGANLDFDPDVPGMWLVELSPWNAPIPLPDPTGGLCPRGARKAEPVWLSTPRLRLLRKLEAANLYGGFRIIRALVGTKPKVKGAPRFPLYPFAQKIREGFVSAEHEATRSLFKNGYKQAFGIIGRGNFSIDRPDWTAAVIAQNAVTIWEAMWKQYEETGAVPLRVETDCIWYPADAKLTRFRIDESGKTLGTYKTKRVEGK